MSETDQIWRKLKGSEGSVVPINLMTIGAAMMVWAYCLWCASPHPCTHHHSSFQADVQVDLCFCTHALLCLHRAAHLICCEGYLSWRAGGAGTSAARAKEVVVRVRRRRDVKITTPHVTVTEDPGVRSLLRNVSEATTWQMAVINSSLCRTCC